MSGETIFVGDNDQSRKAKERMNITDIDTSDPIDVSFSAPVIITPTAVSRSPMTALTPSICDASSRSDDTLRLVLEQARNDAEQSAQALTIMANGIRAVKRILEAASSGEDEGTQQKCITEDLQQIHKFSESLKGVLGSDLLALVNAADMLREHSRLAFQETCDVVGDLRKAKLEAQAAAIDAKRAAKVARSLLKTNADLKRQVKELRQQKRVLVKEVKTLREQDTERRILEQHVLQSLTVHELVLKTPSSALSKKTFFNDDEDRNDRETKASERQTSRDGGKDEVFESTPSEDGRSKNGTGFKRGFRIFRRSNNKAVNEDLKSPDQRVSGNTDTNKFNDDGLLRGFGTPTRHFLKSPLPGLEEISTVTEDSSAVELVDGATRKSEGGRPSYKEGPPLTVTPHYTTDQPSPLTTPDRVSAPENKPLCDAVQIPRVLSLSSSSSDDERECDLPSPRKKITESLYEC